MPFCGIVIIVNNCAEVDFMKFKSNSGKTLFMTIIIVFILVIIGGITYFGIISYPEVFNDIKVKVQQTFNKNEKNNTSSTSDTTSENNDL